MNKEKIFEHTDFNDGNEFKIRVSMVYGNSYNYSKCECSDQKDKDGNDIWKEPSMQYKIIMLDMALSSVFNKNLKLKKRK